MSVGVGPINTGLVTRNYDLIEQFDRMYAKNADALKTSGSGTMKAVSEEDVKAINAKRKSEPKTLSVDSSEIVNNIYSKTGDNITYDVNGVTFSNEEMKACKEVVKNALSFLPTMGSDLDYENYASMGIAANMVSSYVSENLTQEQAQIVNDSFESYLTNLIQAEKERHCGEEYHVDDTDGIGVTGELNKYYSVRMRMSDEAADSLKKQLTANIPQKTRETLLANLNHARESGSVVQSASNKEVAKSIMELFKNFDLKDEDAINNILKQYREIITPVYKSFGLQNTANSNSLSNVIEQDISRFDIQIANARTVISNVGNTCDYIV